MNTYRLRKAYGSNELLIEITSGPEKGNFMAKLEKALCPIKMEIIGSKDLWINDEMIYTANSNLGSFQISVDNWNIAFIMAKENEKIIKAIDSILNEDTGFEKELVT